MTKITNLKPESTAEISLDRSLGPFMVWGLGVGYVISGMYFGWNLGLKEGGTLGMLIATILVSILYIAFVYCYAELASMMPKAGGAFYYAKTVMGPKMGLFAGFAQSVEFVFAPPAIAYAIGAYFSLFFNASPLFIAILAYFLFTAINIYGVKLSASLELFLTIFAVAEILIFVGATAPHFSWPMFLLDPLPNGLSGIFFAIPFAMWFYLAIEGIANIGEEIKDPQKNLGPCFMATMGTLALLAFLVLFCAVGVGGWPSVVFAPGSNLTSDSPLPLALALVVGQDNLLFHLLVTVGLFGLIASFHGIILAAGRATMELGREGYAPGALGHTLKKHKTPAKALLANMFVGLLALLSGRTEDIIIMAVLGAIVMYILSLIVFIVARLNFAHEPRPFRAPFYPLTPIIGLIISFIALLSIIISRPKVALVFLALGLLSWFYFLYSKPPGGHRWLLKPRLPSAT